MEDLMRSVQASKQDLGFMEVLLDGEVRGIFQQADNTIIAIRHERHGKNFKNFSSKDQAIDWLIG